MSEEQQRIPGGYNLLAFPVLLLVGLYVLLNDASTAQLFEAGLVLVAVGALGTLYLLAATGLWGLLREMAGRGGREP